MSGEGQLVIAQGSKRNHPPWDQAGGLQASGFSSGAAPGIAHCGGQGRIGRTDRPWTSAVPRQCPQLGCLINGDA